MNYRHAPKLAFVICTLVLLGACGQEASQQAASSAMSAAIPPMAAMELPVGQTFDAATSTYQDLQGRGLEIASFAGKKVFVNYWATWCAPCIREIPALTRAADELADENYLFLLASDEKLDTISEFINDREFSGHFIKLNSFFGAQGIDAVPSSILYDENGQMLASWAGAYEWDSNEMLDAIRNAGTTLSAD